MGQSMTTFFHLDRESPILRIGLVAGCVVLLAGCSKLGIGDKNPDGTHAAGSGDDNRLQRDRRQ